MIRTAMIALAIGLVAAPLQASAAGRAMVRLALGSGPAAVPAVVAQERGFFAQENLIVSGLSAPSARVAADSLAAGSTDFAIVDQSGLLVMAALGTPVRVVALSHWDAALDLIVPAGAGATTSLAALGGQRIAVVDALGYATLVRLLNTAGVGPDEVAIEMVGPAELGDALRADAVDAALAPRPTILPLLQDGSAERLLGHGQIVERLGLTSAQPLVVRAELVERQPEVVQRFLNAWIKALVYINQDPADAAGLFQILQHRRGVRMPGAEAEAWLGTTRFDRYEWAAEDTQDLQYNGWALVEARMLPALPPLDGLADNSFAERAWQSLLQ
ncbi:MAG: ABC transporter substrate-binding protein [Geminicoccaceae bacterium]|nr:ABC transporter substrate-binding protein [Geminicoccaceae bacterium]